MRLSFPRGTHSDLGVNGCVHLTQAYRSLPREFAGTSLVIHYMDATYPNFIASHFTLVYRLSLQREGKAYAIA